MSTKGVNCIQTQLTGCSRLSHVVVMSKIKTRGVCVGTSPGSSSLPFDGLLLDLLFRSRPAQHQRVLPWMCPLSGDRLSLVLPHFPSFPVQLLCSLSASYLVNELQSVLWCWSDKQSCDSAKCCRDKLYVATNDSVLTDSYLGWSVYFRWLEIPPNVKDVSRSSRSQDGKQEPTQGDISQLLGTDGIPFKLPKLQKHTCLKHPLLGDSTFYPSILVVVKFSLSAQVSQAVDSKRNGTSSALLCFPGKEFQAQEWWSSSGSTRLLFCKVGSGCQVLEANSLWQGIAPLASEWAYSGQKNCA